MKTLTIILLLLSFSAFGDEKELSSAEIQEYKRQEAEQYAERHRLAEIEQKKWELQKLSDLVNRERKLNGYFSKAPKSVYCKQFVRFGVAIGTINDNGRSFRETFNFVTNTNNKPGLYMIATQYPDLNQFLIIHIVKLVYANNLGEHQARELFTKTCKEYMAK